MVIFGKIICVIYAIWFVTLCLRPIERTRQGWEAHEKWRKSDSRRFNLGEWIAILFSFFILTFFYWLLTNKFLLTLFWPF